MIFIWVPVCIALTFLASAYVVDLLLRWRRSHSMTWPTTLSSAKQAAICKLFLARKGIQAKYPVLITMKYHLELWQGRNGVLLSFGSPGFPHTRALFQDLSEFRQLKFPQGNCAVVVFYQEITDTKGFDWAKEFLIPILHPKQIDLVSELLRSNTENLVDALFEISAYVTAAKGRKHPPENAALFSDLSGS